MYRWLPAVAFMGFLGWVIYEADMGHSNYFIMLASMIPYGDKVGHALLYGLLAGLVIVATQFRVYRFGGWAVFVGSIPVLLFALGEEGTQYFISTRNFELLDALADLIGIGLAHLLAQGWLKLRIHSNIINGL